MNKRMKSHILYVFMMFFMISVLGCAPSPGPESPEAGPAPHQISNGEQVLSQNQIPRDYSPRNDIKQKLARLIDYVRYSRVVFDHALSLGALLTEFNLNYDWENGADDTLGKLLKIIPNKYSAHDTYLGLIEILENRTFLQELIDFFTNDPFLTPDQRKEFISAIQNDDLATIGALIDTIYLSLLKEFSDKYHVQIKWKEEESQQIRESIVKLFKLLLKNYFDLKSPLAVEASPEQPEKKADEAEPLPRGHAPPRPVV